MFQMSVTFIYTIIVFILCIFDSFSISRNQKNTHKWCYLCTFGNPWNQKFLFEKKCVIYEFIDNIASLQIDFT